MTRQLESAVSVIDPYQVPAIHALQQKTAAAVVKGQILLPAHILAPLGAQAPLLQVAVHHPVLMEFDCQLFPAATHSYTCFT